MSKRTSIYIGDALQRLLEARTTADGEGLRSTSAALNAVADRYTEIVRHSTPRLTACEWCLVWDALNGIWLQDTASLYVRAVAIKVADAIRLNGADRKWGVDGDRLIGRLAEMSFCHLVAIVDSAERFWSRSDWPKDRREMVEAVVGAGALE